MEFVAFVFSVVALMLSAIAVWYASRAVREVIRHARPMSPAEHGRAQAIFRLQHVSAHRYVLHNDGTAVARRVRIEPGEVVIQNGDLTFDSFQPGRTEEYLLFQPLQGRVNEIVITWQDDGFEVRRLASLPLNTHVVHDDDLGE